MTALKRGLFNRLISSVTSGVFCFFNSSRTLSVTPRVLSSGCGTLISLSLISTTFQLIHNIIFGYTICGWQVLLFLANVITFLLNIKILVAKMYDIDKKELIRGVLNVRIPR